MTDQTEGKKKSAPANTLTEADMIKRTLTTKEQLDAQPKRRIRLPKAQDPKEPNYETVQINGYTFTIMKGVDVDVPDEVAQILYRTGRY